MTCSRSRKHLLARATAWLLILICGWMGTDGVLHHTDGGSSPCAAFSVHHATSAVPADTCAACEWTQGMQTGTLSVCCVQSPPFIMQPRPVTAVRRLARRVSRRSSPRAPPLFLTTC